MAFIVGEIAAKIGGDTGGFERAMTRIKRVGAKTVRNLVVATGAVGILAAKLAADFQKGTTEISTLMGDLTEGEMHDMRNQLQALAGDTGLALSKLTKARYDVVSAGFADAASSAKLMNEAAQLAVASNSEASTTADVLTTSLNAYDESADHAARVSDVLFTTVRLGKTTMDELGSSLGRAIPLAAELGVDFESLSAGVATLTARGQSTDEAVTALRSTFTQILKPTAALQGLIEDLGFASGRALIDAEGLSGGLRLIQQQASRSNVDLADAFANIRAMQAAFPLAGDAADQFAENLRQVRDSSGATATAAEKMQETFTVQFNRLRNNIQNALIQIGDVIIEWLQPAVEKANNLFANIGNIGWDNIMGMVRDNWGAIVDFISDYFSLVWNRLLLQGKIRWKRFLSDLPGFTKIFTGAWKHAVEKANKTSQEHISTIDQGLEDLRTQFAQTMQDLANQGKDLEGTTAPLAPGIENAQQAFSDLTLEEQVYMAGMGLALDTTNALRDTTYAVGQTVATVAVPATQSWQEEMDKTFQTVMGVGQVLSQNIGNALIEVADRAKNAAEAFHDAWHAAIRSIAAQIASRAALFALAQIFTPEKAIGGFVDFLFGGFLAQGGPVRSGTSYVVGEEGPELFTPNQSGRIHTQTQMQIHLTGEFRMQGGQLVAVVDETRMQRQRGS